MLLLLPLLPLWLLLLLLLLIVLLLLLLLSVILGVVDRVGLPLGIITSVNSEYGYHPSIPTGWNSMIFAMARSCESREQAQTWCSHHENRYLCWDVINHELPKYSTN